MIIDARGQSYSEIFDQIKDASSNFYSPYEELLIFVDPNDLEKSRALREFVEFKFTCRTDLLEASGFYIIRAIHDTVGMEAQTAI